MTYIINKSDLDTYAKDQARYNVRGIYEKARRETRSFSSSTKNVFLSHSHKNRSEIEKTVAFFKTLGISIYVDWMDDGMPASPNGETAERIKKKIIENDKFILLATNEAVASKWCNWEIGHGDAAKLRSDDMALFPIADNSSGWIGNEYLQIYPTIQRQYQYLSSDFLVVYPNSKQAQKLQDWLKR